MTAEFVALEPTQEIKSIYSRQFQLTYLVMLSERQLTTELHVRNPPMLGANIPSVLEFQALFHNYLRAPSKQALIEPLKGISYYDKTEGRSKVETRETVDAKTFTDSIYQDAHGSYKVTWPGGGISINSTNFKDVVIWNPQEHGRGIVDMEEDGWYVQILYLSKFVPEHCHGRERYVCVEPGHVEGFVGLEAGETWIGRQVLSVLD